MLEKVHACHSQFPGLWPYFEEFYEAMVRTRITCEKIESAESRHYGNYRADRDRILLSGDITLGISSRSERAISTLVHELFHATSANNQDLHNELQHNEVFPGACESDELNRLDDRVMWLTALCTNDTGYLDLLLSRIEACGLTRGCHQVLRTETDRNLLDSIPILSILGPRFHNPTSNRLGQKQVHSVCNSLSDHLVHATECLRARRDPDVIRDLLATDRWQALMQRIRERREELWQGNRFSSRWLSVIPSSTRQQLDTIVLAQPECVSRFKTPEGDLTFDPVRSTLGMNSDPSTLGEINDLITWTQGLYDAVNRGRDTLRALRISNAEFARDYRANCRETLSALNDTLDAIEITLGNQFTIPSMHSRTEVPRGGTPLDRQFSAQIMDLAQGWQSTFFSNTEGSRRLLGEDLLDDLRRAMDTAHPQGTQFDCSLIQRIRPTLPTLIESLSSPPSLAPPSTPCPSP